MEMYFGQGQCGDIARKNVQVSITITSDNMNQASQLIIKYMKLIVRKYINDNPDGGGILGGPIINRSCWICNSGHTYLRHRCVYPFQCYDCGEIYYRGVRLKF